MSKQHKRTNRAKKVREAVATFFAIAVFVVPIILTISWVVIALGQRDTRSVQSVPQFYTRKADATPAKLQPFNEPLFSVTFDDGWESVYTQAFPLLQRSGFHTTQYVITDTFGNPSYMSIAQLRSMQTAGTEIASHTVSHADLTTLDSSELKRELANSQTTLRQDFGDKIVDFTSPYGAYNAYTLKMISAYYRSQKNAEGDPAANEIEAINLQKSFNPLNIISYSVRSTTTIDDLKKLLKATQDYNGWLVLTYHQIDNSNDTYTVTPAAFKQQMAYLSQSPIRDAPLGKVLDALQPRKGN